MKKNLIVDTVEYFVTYLGSLVAANFTDYTLTSLALACVGLGFLTNPLIAVVTYLFVYVVLKTINSIANAIGQGTHNVALSLRDLAQVFVQPVPNIPVKDDDSDS